jgi:hypothetical protein
MSVASARRRKILIKCRALTRWSRSSGDRCDVAELEVTSLQHLFRIGETFLMQLHRSRPEPRKTLAKTHDWAA